MKASHLILAFAALAVGYFLIKQKGLFAPQVPTQNKLGGTSPTVGSKDDFQSAADDIASIFSTATKFFGNGSAQTAPSTM